jgi:hypothetical protein
MIRRSKRLTAAIRTHGHRTLEKTWPSFQSSAKRAKRSQSLEDAKERLVRFYQRAYSTSVAVATSPCNAVNAFFTVESGSWTWTTGEGDYLGNYYYRTSISVFFCLFDWHQTWGHECKKTEDISAVQREPRESSGPTERYRWYRQPRLLCTEFKIFRKKKIFLVLKSPLRHI